MRKWLLLVAVALGAMGNSGCLLNQYASDPNTRMEELIFESENLRQISKEWRRFWMLDQPSHLTYDRVHGGIGPS
jgi:hypothetical protein